jgi:hypothetical protein
MKDFHNRPPLIDTRPGGATEFKILTAAHVITIIFRTPITASLGMEPTKPVTDYNNRYTFIA